MSLNLSVFEKADDSTRFLHISEMLRTSCVSVAGTPQEECNMSRFTQLRGKVVYDKHRTCNVYIVYIRGIAHFQVQQTHNTPHQFWILLHNRSLSRLTVRFFSKMHPFVPPSSSPTFRTSPPQSFLRILPDEIVNLVVSIFYDFGDILTIFVWRLRDGIHMQGAMQGASENEVALANNSLWAFCLDRFQSNIPREPSGTVS